MSEASRTAVSERRTAQQVIQRLQAEGWTVVEEPRPEHLPDAVAPYRPDLIAQRGDEHLIVEIKSRRTPPNLDTVALAEEVAGLPGWRLDLVYVPEESAPADQDQLLRWASTARTLADSAPEAALLLVWAAVEGLLHQLAERRGVDTDQPGRLLATLASLGDLTDDEQDFLRRAMQMRKLLAHGRQAPAVDSTMTSRLTELATELAARGSSSPL